MAQVKPSLVHYPRFKELHEDIRLCQEMSRMTHEPSCMVLEGVTGAGKTTLVRAYAGAFPRRHTLHKTIVPILYTATPAPLTVKAMASKMLEELGDPAAYRGTLWAKNQRLVHFIRECEIELVILDDFHHLIDSDSNRVNSLVSDWLKNLIKQTGVPYLVIGIENSVERILQANSQLSRLFAVREVLRPFAWEFDNEETIQQFATFIHYAEATLDLVLSDEIERIQLVARLYEATGGVVGNVMKLLQLAKLLAVRSGETAVGLTHLKLAFQKGLQIHMGLKNNPFTRRYALGQNIPHYPDPADGVGNRSRPLKESAPPLSHILKR